MLEEYNMLRQEKEEEKQRQRVSIIYSINKVQPSIWEILVKKLFTGKMQTMTYF